MQQDLLLSDESIIKVTLLTFLLVADFCSVYSNIYKIIIFSLQSSKDRYPLTFLPLPLFILLLPSPST